MSQISIMNRKVNLRGLVGSPEKGDIINAILLLICQRAEVFGMFPFGVVYFGAVCSPQLIWLNLPMLIIGTLISEAATVKYLIASLIVWVFKIIMAQKDDNYITGAIICAGAVFIGGIYNAFMLYPIIYGLAMLIGEVLLCAVCYPVFANIHELRQQCERNEPVSKEYSVSLVLVLAVALWGLTGIELPFSVSLKSIAAIFMVLCITVYSSIPVSVTFAAVCGFVSSPNSVEALILAGMYAVCAVFSGLLKYFGQLGASVGFLTGVTVSVLFAGGTNFTSLSLVDIFIATAVFAVIPGRFHQQTGIFLANAFKPSTERRDFRIKEYIVDELNCFSYTFSEFARQFKSTFQKNQENEKSEAARIFDETAERICNDCNRNSDCWQKNFNDTYKYLFSILETTEKTGYCNIHNAPIVFTQRCIQPELFLNEFNHVYELRKQDALRSGVRSADRRLVSNQYSEISKIITELSEEIEGNFFFDEQKEKKILSECSKAGLFIRDINVIRNRDGYYEMFFAPGTDADSDAVCDIATDVMGMKMKKVFCKNTSIIRLAADNVYEVKVSVCQKKRDDEAVCGDTVVHFETDKNKYYVILCDGMGSGSDASKESKMTAELLGGFLKAGFSKSIALSLINSTLALKMDREGFSTIDLCEIDLRSGLVEFVKVGGAQSYVRQAEKTETIMSKGLPAGILEEVSSERITRTLYDGDMVVMVSDGVSDAGYGMMRGEWVKKLMNLDGLENDEIAESIVNSARKKIYPRTADDMTAVVIELSNLYV